MGIRIKDLHTFKPEHLVQGDARVIASYAFGVPMQKSTIGYPDQMPWICAELMQPLIDTANDTAIHYIEAAMRQVEEE